MLGYVAALLSLSLSLSLSFSLSLCLSVSLSLSVSLCLSHFWKFTCLQFGTAPAQPCNAAITHSSNSATGPHRRKGPPACQWLKNVQSVNTLPETVSVKHARLCKNQWCFSLLTPTVSYTSSLNAYIPAKLFPPTAVIPAQLSRAGLAGGAGRLRPPPAGPSGPEPNPQKNVHVGWSPHGDEITQALVLPWLVSAGQRREGMKPNNDLILK